MSHNPPFGGDLSSCPPVGDAVPSTGVLQYPTEFAPPPSDPQTPRAGGCWNSVLILGALGLVVVAVAALIYFGSYGKEPFDVDNEAAVASLQPETKFRFSRQAFNQREIQVDHADHMAIRSLIERLLRAGLEDDPESARQDLNKTGFLNQLQRSGRFPSMTALDRMAIRNDFEELVDGPTGYDRFHIASIRRLDEQEVLAYVYAWDTGSYSTEFCYWLVKTGNGWQMSDWEPLRLGLSDCTEYSILCEGLETPGIENYYRAMDNIASFYDQFVDDETSARRLLQQAENLTLARELHDYTMLVISEAYQWAGDPAEARRVVAKVRDLQQFPGGYMTLGKLALQEGDYEAAIEAFTSYIDRVGESPGAFRRRSIAYERIAEYEHAVLDQVRFLRALPDDSENAIYNIGRMAWRVPTAKFMDDLNSLERPDLADRFLVGLDSWIDLARIDIADRLLQPKLAGQDDLIAGLRHALRYECTPAIDRLRKARSELEDDRLINIAEKWILESALKMERPIDAYELATDKEAAMALIRERYDEDELELAADQMLLLMGKHREVDSGDPWLEYYEGTAYLEKGDREAARRAFERGLAKTPDPDDSAASTYGWELAKLLLEESDVGDVYASYPDKEQLFSTAAVQLQDHDSVALGQLLEMHRPHVEDESFFRRQELRYLRMLDDHAAAMKRLDEIELDLDSDYVAAWYHRSARVKHLVEQGTWREYLPQHADDESVSRLFSSLCHRLQDDGAWEQLSELIDLAAESGLPEGDILEAKLDFAIAKGDDDMLLAMADQQDPHRWTEQLESYQVSSAILRMVLLRLRNGNAAEAARLAESTEEINSLPALLVAIASDDHDKLRHVLENDETSHLVDELWDYPEAETYFSDSGHAELRKEFPPSFINYPQEATVVLFYSNEPPVSGARIKSSLASATGCQPTLSRPDRSAVVSTGKSVFAECGRTRIALTGLNRPSDYEWEDPPPHVVDLLRPHQKSLCITVLSPADDRDAAMLTLKLAAQFLTEDCLAVYDALRSELILNPRERIPQLVRANQVAAPDAENLWINFMDSALDDEIPWGRRRRIVQGLVHHLESDQPRASQVMAEVSFGAVEMAKWMNLVEVTHEGEVIVELEDGDFAVPYPGRYRLSWWQVVDFRTEDAVGGTNDLADGSEVASEKEMTEMTEMSQAP